MPPEENRRPSLKTNGRVWVVIVFLFLLLLAAVISVIRVTAWQERGIKLPVHLEAGRLYTIVCIAVGDRVNLSGELENHLRGLDLNTTNCPGTLLVGAVS